jgi:hypothetical protein
MPLPGFNAETSLYKSSVCYHLMDAYVQAGRVVPQQFPLPFTCGPCELVTGACAQRCSRIHCGGGWPFCTIEVSYVPCPPYMCLPQ